MGKREAEEKAQVEAEAKAAAKVEAKAKAEAEERAKAEAKAKVEAEERAKAEAQAKAEAEKQAKAEAEAQAKAEAEAQAKAKADAESEEKAKREAALNVPHLTVPSRPEGMGRSSVETRSSVRFSVSASSSGVLDAAQEAMEIARASYASSCEQIQEEDDDDEESDDGDGDGEDHELARSPSMMQDHDAAQSFAVIDVQAAIRGHICRRKYYLKRAAMQHKYD